MSNASKLRDTVDRHYGTGELVHRVRQALLNAYSDKQTLNSAELAPISQFHVGGLAATKANNLSRSAAFSVLHYPVFQTT
jgi:hypothetical protein